MLDMVLIGAQVKVECNLSLENRTRTHIFRPGDTVYYDFGQGEISGIIVYIDNEENYMTILFEDGSMNDIRVVSIAKYNFTRSGDTVYDHHTIKCSTYSKLENLWFRTNDGTIIQPSYFNNIRFANKDGSFIEGSLVKTTIGDGSVEFHINNYNKIVINMKCHYIGHTKSVKLNPDQNWDLISYNTY